MNDPAAANKCVDDFAAGRLGRREFLSRAALLGLSGGASTAATGAPAPTAMAPASGGGATAVRSP